MRWDADAQYRAVQALSKVMSVDVDTHEVTHLLAGELRAYVQNLLAGVASPSTEPAVTEGVPMMYLAMEAGAYPNFIDTDTGEALVVLAGEWVSLFTDGTLPVEWQKESLPYEASYQVWEAKTGNVGKTLAEYVDWLGHVIDSEQAILDAAEQVATDKGIVVDATEVAVAAAEQTALDRIATGKDAQTATTKAGEASGSAAAALQSKNYASGYADDADAARILAEAARDASIAKVGATVVDVLGTSTANATSQRIVTDSIEKSLSVAKIADSTFSRTHFLYADNGTSASAPTIDMVRIDAKEGDQIRYTGGIGTGYHSILAFNSSDVVIGTFNTNATIYAQFYTCPVGTSYVRCQARNSVWGTTPTMIVDKFTYVALLDEAVNSLEDSINTKLIDPLTVLTPATHNLLYNDNGTTTATANIDATDLIPVSLYADVYYTGDVGSTYHGILAYDALGQIVETAFTNGAFLNAKYSVTNANVKYIRAQARNTNYGSISNPLSIEINQSVAILTEVTPSIIIRPISSTSFDVDVLQRTNGKYITHRFVRQYYTRLVKYGSEPTATHSEVCGDCWYAEEIYDNGVRIMQGNANFINYIDDVANEAGYVGEGHGATFAAFVKFFADGVVFDPTTLINTIRCETFRILEKNLMYAIDITQPNFSGDNAVPKFDASGVKELSTVHLLDATYSVNNKIEYRHRLTVKRNSTKFKYCFGAMFEIKGVAFNKVFINDSDGTLNGIVYNAGAWTATPEGGSTVTFATNQYNKASEIVAYGVSYIAKQSMIQFVNSREGKSSIQLRFYTGTDYRLKIYQQPVVTAETASLIGESAEVFNDGDSIEVFVKREIDIQ